MDCGHFWIQEQVKTRMLKRHKHAAPKDFLRVTSAPPVSNQVYSGEGADAVI